MPVYVLGRKTFFQPIREIRGGSTYIRVRYQYPLSYISAISRRSQVGRLIPREGVHHLLKAMRTITETEPKTVLILVGSAF